MKEIKAADRNLISIAYFTDCYEDRKYFTSLISKLLTLPRSGASIWLARPSYDYDTGELVKQLSDALPMNEIFTEPEYFIVSFACSADKVTDNLLIIFAKLWFAFEHAVYVFSEASDYVKTMPKPWYETTSSSKAFVMFKDAEQDVIWIGKSSDLQFDL